MIDLNYQYLKLERGNKRDPPGHLKANDASNDRSRVAANPHVDRLPVGRVLQHRDPVHHVKGHVTDLKRTFD